MPSKPTLAILLKGYPRLSETFIAQEILALERRGYPVHLFSLRHPTDKAIHPIHREIKAPVTYLPEYIHHEPMRVLRAFVHQCAKPGFWKAAKQFMADFRHDFTRNRIRRLAQAIVFADEMPESIDHIYVHFMHTPASVAHYTHYMSERPWSISAHAKDIWTISDHEKRTKLASAQWLVTCTSSNYTHLKSLSNQVEKVHLLYHGLDFNRFDAPDPLFSDFAGTASTRAVRLLSVGRAVEKKGYDVLLSALKQLKDLQWTFTHIGGGERLEALKKMADEYGLSERINWAGALPQEDVLAAYRQSDLFVLPSKITADGDRDGLPNVLMEAQSQYLACLSTDISGIPELIIHNETGWLVPQQSANTLAEGLRHLITQPDERARLATAGQKRVTETFTMHRGIDQLEALFTSEQTKGN